MAAMTSRTNEQHRGILTSVLFCFTAPPSRPTTVVANVACDSVRLTWDIPKDNGGMAIVHYVLDFDNQRWNTKDTYPLYYIENLKRGKVYTIQLRARNKMGVGDHETVTVTTSEYCKSLANGVFLPCAQY